MYEQFVHRDILNIFPWIKARTLISWSERGLVKPDFSNAAGRGSSRVYSYSNLIEIGIVSEFLRHGIPFSIIEEIMNGDAVRRLKEEKDFNVVIWSDRTICGVSAKISTPDLLAGGTAVSRQTTSTDATIPMANHVSAQIDKDIPVLPMENAVFGQLVTDITWRTAHRTVCIRFEDFLADGGVLLLGGGKEDVTSILIINVKGIKMYVDRQIQGMK